MGINHTTLLRSEEVPIDYRYAEKVLYTERDLTHIKPHKFWGLQQPTVMMVVHYGLFREKNDVCERHIIPGIFFP